MADHPQNEDTAVRYVLGELNLAERREFEARMKRSADLRAEVHDLEEGIVASSLVCPQQQPPVEVWQQIEQIVADEMTPKVVVTEFRINWLRYGWAAVACLVAGFLLGGWLMRSVLVNDLSSPGDSLKTTGLVPSLSSAGAGDMHGRTPDRSREMGVLRQEFGNSEAGATSQSLTNVLKPAADSTASQIRFFSGASATNALGTSTDYRPSPELQQALFIGMAHDLGWLPFLDSQFNADVDVVDLRPVLNVTPVVRTPGASLTASGALLGFASDGNIVLVFDSTLAPEGTELEFWVGSSARGQQLLGTAPLGDNPLVMIIPMSTGPSSAWTLTVITNGPPLGASNVLGQLFISAPPQP